jgi:hypothetical protein
MFQAVIAAGAPDDGQLQDRGSQRRQLFHHTAFPFCGIICDRI